MNMAVGSLVFLGLMSILGGMVTKLLGMSPLSPWVENAQTYLLIANSCFLLALVVDRFGKE